MKIQHITFLAVLTLLASCKKEPLKSTTANNGIVGSEWFFPVTETQNLWEELGIVTGGTYFRTEFFAPDISNQTIENSVILLYANLTGYDHADWPKGHIGLLPTVVYKTNGIHSADDWTMGISSHRLSIRLQNSKSFYPNGGPDKGHSFRYIIIPKSTAVVTGQKPTNQNPLSRYSESELRNLTYDEICNTAGIKK